MPEYPGKRNFAALFRVSIWSGQRRLLGGAWGRYCLLLPSYQFEAAVWVFDDGGAAFDEVAGIHIQEAFDVFDFSMMDVAAYHAVHTFVFQGFDDGFFVVRHELDDVFHFEFYEGRQGKMRLHAEKAADGAQATVDFNQPVVTYAAQFGHPAVMLGDGVVFVAMYHQEAFALRGGVNIGFFDHDVAEHVIGIIPDIFIVIAGHINDLGAMTGLAQDFLDDRIVIAWPVHFFRQGPKVDDVADQVQFFAVVMFQKVQ